MPGLLDQFLTPPDATGSSTAPGQIPAGLLSGSYGRNAGGLLGLLNSDEARLGLSMLAAAGPSAYPMGTGQRMLAGMAMYGDMQDRDARRQQTQLGSLKTSFELQKLLDDRQRQQSIQTGLRKLGQEDQSAQARAAVVPQLDSSPADAYGSAGISGTPMYSMNGPAMFGAQPAVALTAPQPQGVMRGAMPPQTAVLNAGQPAQMAELGPSRGNYGQGLSNRFLKQAEVYASAGDLEHASKLYDQAAKWMPEVHKIEVAMKDGQPVNVITLKDGRQVVSPFSPTPKTHWADTGGSVQAIDEYTMQPRGGFKKTMTPDAVASNQVAWANNRNSVDRLNFDRTQVGKPQFHDGQWLTPPNASNPQGTATSVPGFTKPLTEFQGKSTNYASRMQDASRVLAELDGQEGGPPSPSQVAQAGYHADMPNWLPGGQAIGGALTAANNTFNPMVTDSAQRYRQAQENWVTANLRQESGAAIGRDEMLKDITKWFPQPGDTEGTKAQKAAARKVAERAMLAQAGPGAQQVSGIVGGQSFAGSATGPATPSWRYVNGKLVKVN